MLELGEITNVLSGVSIREPEDRPARFMRLSDLADLKAGRGLALGVGERPIVARALPIEEGDLIVGARGAATDVCLANPSVFGAYVSLDLYLVRPDVWKVDPSYLVAVLELPATQLLFSGNKQGSSLARLPKEALEKLPVPLPPLPKQRLIADLARSFVDEDRLLRRLAALNSILGREAIARAIRATEARPNS